MPFPVSGARCCTGIPPSPLGCPGHEEDSWKRFYEEAFDKFIEGTYAGQYQEMVIEEFNQYLPEDPPWSK